MKIHHHTLFAFLLATFYPLTESFSQNDEGFIYGEVTTIDDQKFKGLMRWDSEETFWTDIFNSKKVDNPNTKLFPSTKPLESKSDEGQGYSDYNFFELWGEKNKNCCNYPVSIHQFAVRFGDIKTIKITDRSAVTLTFKDGEKLKVQGGSNDVRARINMYEEELGEINMRWDRISQIEFMDSPKKIDNKPGEPLYGTVETIRGSLKGFIQWDHEECLSTDKLDGHNENGKMSVDMGNIKKIDRYARGVNLTLKSGREVKLFNTNDVDASNRGIVVKNDKIGKALIDWSDFESVTFEDAPNSGPSYSDFTNPKRIQGTVYTFDEQEVTGLIVFDLDEVYDYELLEGKDYNIEYSIPFRMIDRIKPKNYNYSMVYTKGGAELLLGDLQDVTDRNDGLIVMQSEDDKEPKYISWKRVKEIDFK